ncbi:MAG: SurA N-terminal domain-containing protein [Gammaproteobacteria bacterium]|nr:SurA N-terminal domain-containing protein [Gammaproteobacteria bacterium]
MLQAIREKVTGWIAYGIIFLISIPFALWGINSYFGGGEAQPAATVNGQEITSEALDRAYANYRQRLSQLFGGAIPESFGSETMLREQVLGQLIEETALRQYIDDQRYRIGDAELSRIIRGMDVFQRDGRFDSDIYEAQLRSLGYSPLGFEQELRANGAMQQFQAGIQQTSFTPPYSQKRFTSLANQTRKLRTLRHSLDAADIEVDDNQIEEFYQAQADRYRTPEQVKIDYIEVSLEGIKQGIKVSRDDAYARYQDHLDNYTSPETRETSHILIKADSDEQSDQALARITGIRKRIVNGEDFAELARALSEDPGSASEGGNLGEIERGVMVPTFESELFALQEGQLSEPVKTAFGWHLIKLHSIKGGATRSFESLQAELENEIKTEKAEVQIYNLVENLANLAYEQPDSLLPAAEQLGLGLQTSDWFDRFSGDGIAAEQKIRQAAFSAEVLQQQLNSEAIELGSERVVFIRLNQRKPSQQQPLEQVREQVRSELIAKNLREQNLAAGNEALAGLQAGKSLDELAQEWSTGITDHGFITRQQSEIDAIIRSRAFNMPKPERGIVYDGLSLSNGDYVIVELSAVLSSDAEADQESLVRLNEGIAGVEYQAAVKTITGRAEVVRTQLEEL